MPRSCDLRGGDSGGALKILPADAWLGWQFVEVACHNDDHNICYNLVRAIFDAGTAPDLNPAGSA